MGCRVWRVHVHAGVPSPAGLEGAGVRLNKAEFRALMKTAANTREGTVGWDYNHFCNLVAEAGGSLEVGFRLLAVCVRVFLCACFFGFFLMQQNACPPPPPPPPPHPLPSS